MEMRQGQRRFPIFSVVKVLIAAYLVTMVILLVLAGLLYKLELSEPVVDGGSLRPMCCPVFWAVSLWESCRKRGNLCGG